jgi:CMP-N,N'-diacetyllegionaminic acid synthase
LNKNEPKKILGIIPARGGSKGIPNKNIRFIKGKPLIYYTIQAAKNAELLTDFIVSTDSEKIAEIACNNGAMVPFMRPQSLAKDSTESLPVIIHALTEYEKINNISYDYFIMLQPTSPFRTGKDIDHALIQLTTCNSDSIVSVVDVGGSHPLRMKIINDDKMLVNYIFQEKENMKPRQKLEKVYIRNGCIYASKVEVLFNEKSIVGKSCIPYVMSKENSINIDNELDFITAEILMNKLV